MGKSIEVANAQLEEIASNNYHWSSERTALKRSSGRYEVDALTLLASRVDVLAQRLDRMSATMALPPLSMLTPFKALTTPQNISQSITYNQSQKSHSNLLYKNSNPHPQSPIHPAGYQYRTPYHPPPPLAQPKSNFESFMEHFMAAQTKTNGGLTESINQQTCKFEAMASQQKVWISILPKQLNKLVICLSPMSIYLAS